MLIVKKKVSFAWRILMVRLIDTGAKSNEWNEVLKFIISDYLIFLIEKSVSPLASARNWIL